MGTTQPRVPAAWLRKDHTRVIGQSKLEALPPNKQGSSEVHYYMGDRFLYLTSYIKKKSIIIKIARVIFVILFFFLSGGQISMNNICLKF